MSGLIETKQYLIDWVNTIPSKVCVLANNYSDFLTGDVFYEIIKYFVFTNPQVCCMLDSEIEKISQAAGDSKIELIISFLSSFTDVSGLAVESEEAFVVDLISRMKKMFECSNKKEEVPEPCSKKYHFKANTQTVPYDPVLVNKSVKLYECIVPKETNERKQDDFSSRIKEKFENKKNHCASTKSSKSTAFSIENVNNLEISKKKPLSNTPNLKEALNLYMFWGTRSKSELYFDKDVKVGVFNFIKPTSVIVGVDNLSVKFFNKYQPKLLTKQTASGRDQEASQPNLVIRNYTEQEASQERNKKPVQLTQSEANLFGKFQKMIDWLFTVGILKSKLISISKLVFICSDGVFIADLINKLEGRDIKITGIVRQHQSQVQVNLNFNKICQFLYNKSSFQNKCLLINFDCLSQANVALLLFSVFIFYSKGVMPHIETTLIESLLSCVDVVDKIPQAKNRSTKHSEKKIINKVSKKLASIEGQKGIKDPVFPDNFESRKIFQNPRSDIWNKSLSPLAKHKSHHPYHQYESYKHIINKNEKHHSKEKESDCFSFISANLKRDFNRSLEMHHSGSLQKSMIKDNEACSNSKPNPELKSEIRKWLINLGIPIAHKINFEAKFYVEFKDG